MTEQPKDGGPAFPMDSRGFYGMSPRDLRLVFAGFCVVVVFMGMPL